VLRPGLSTEPPHGFADSGTDLQSAAEPAPAATGARAVTTCGASHQAPRPGVSDPTNTSRPPLSSWPPRYAATSIRPEKSPVMGPRRRTRRPDSQRVRCKRRADPPNSRAGTDRRWLRPSSGSRLTPAKQAPLVFPKAISPRPATRSTPSVTPPYAHHDRTIGTTSVAAAGTPPQARDQLWSITRSIQTTGSRLRETSAARGCTRALAISPGPKW
jgi:hypothetical protein